MAQRGLLETMARRDLDALLTEVASGYRPGTLDTLDRADPEWRDALDRAEREVGALFLTLCEADQALADWRRAIAELSRLWRRVHDGEAPSARSLTESLADVA
jgi:hypothetical protein